MVYVFPIFVIFFGKKFTSQNLQVFPLFCCVILLFFLNFFSNFKKNISRIQTFERRREKINNLIFAIFLRKQRWFEWDFFYSVINEHGKKSELEMRNDVHFVVFRSTSVENGKKNVFFYKNMLLHKISLFYDRNSLALCSQSKSEVEYLCPKKKNVYRRRTNVFKERAKSAYFIGVNVKLLFLCLKPDWSFGTGWSDAACFFSFFS